jgi:hypothetical protein
MSRLRDKFASPAYRNRFANYDWLAMWLRLTVLSSVFLGLCLALVIIAYVKDNRALLLVSLAGSAWGLWNVRSSARILRSTAAQRTQKA